MPIEKPLSIRECSPALVAALILIAILLANPCAQAAVPVPIPGHKNNNDVKRQVEDLEQQWRTAQLSGDVATMDKLLSDDYIGISLNGQVNTKAQQIQRYSSRRVSLTRLDLTEMKVKLIGDIAIVTSRAEVEGTADGSSIKGTYRYTRVYQRLPSGSWKITSFEATRIPTPNSPGNRPPPPPHNNSATPAKFLTKFLN
jgi:ketosteroid isomerase-like protein